MHIHLFLPGTPSNGTTFRINNKNHSILILYVFINCGPRIIYIFSQLSMLDVMQIFGRAGRPQFDKSGEAILLTSHEHLNHYLHLLNHALPIESTLIQVKFTK